MLCGILRLVSSRSKWSQTTLSNAPDISIERRAVSFLLPLVCLMNSKSAEQADIVDEPCRKPCCLLSRGKVLEIWCIRRVCKTFSRILANMLSRQIGRKDLMMVWSLSEGFLRKIRLAAFQGVGKCPSLREQL